MTWADWSVSAAEGELNVADPEDDLRWATSIARRVVRVVRGGTPEPLKGRRVNVTIIDDDEGGPYPAPSRREFIDTLRESGVDVRDRDRSDAPGIVALFGDIRAWKGRPGYSDSALAAVREAVSVDPACVVLQFSHPRLADSVPGEVVISAWGGERAMQRAAGEWLAGVRG
jgi:hypothetical protein